jgi:hypothetical protein
MSLDGRDIATEDTRMATVHCPLRHDGPGDSQSSSFSFSSSSSAVSFSSASGLLSSHFAAYKSYW